MVTKMADEIGLRYRNCHFGPNLKLLATDFFKNKISAQANTKNTFKYIVCLANSHHLFKVSFFCIILYSILIPLLHVSDFLQNGHFPIFSLFWRPFLLP